MIQIIKAPSILGLRPTGVESLAEALLQNGLEVFVTPQAPLLEVETLNSLYSTQRDEDGMINAQPLHDFSLRLKPVVEEVVQNRRFPLVLGGDCSILLGTLSAMKSLGRHGLVTLDAHADFYLQSESLTGEAADMDIALVTGRGPKILTDLQGLGPYMEDAHVLHVGQRDEEETRKYGAAQISQTAIRLYGLDMIRRLGLETATSRILKDMEQLGLEGFWLHLDTDVLDDAENPAVDYRLPGGLKRSECGTLLRALLRSGLIKGLSVSIYNPLLDPEGLAGRGIVQMLLWALS